MFQISIINTFCLIFSITLELYLNLLNWLTWKSFQESDKRIQNGGYLANRQFIISSSGTIQVYNCNYYDYITIYVLIN